MKYVETKQNFGTINEYVLYDYVLIFPSNNSKPDQVAVTLNWVIAGGLMFSHHQNHILLHHNPFQ